MEKKKIFVDGSAGTTGLRINERLEKRSDVILMQVDEELRKDPEYRKKMINESDYTFLCLPDAAAIEAVSFLDKDNDHTVIIDASTAHRTNPDWAYGLPELGKEFRDKIATNRLIAVPGCYASGFNMLVCPMVKMGIMGSDYPVSVTALSGYSGAGKKAIELYESDQKTEDLFDIKILNLFYILTKYIFRNSFYFFQIPLLLYMRKMIIFIIKTKLTLLCYFKSKYEKDLEINYRIDYIIKRITDTEYYYRKYIEHFRFCKLNAIKFFFLILKKKK